MIPERELAPDAVVAEVSAAFERGKAHALVVVAEGAHYNAARLERYCREFHGQLGFELRVTQLGHVQRGGIPTVADRLLATRLGAAAIDRLARGEHGVLVGLGKGEVVATPLAEVVTGEKALDLRLLDLAQMLAM